MTPAEVQAHLAHIRARGVLRFLTCGSVDDGKSTLIGRLLFDSRAVMDDQMAALGADSRQYGTTGDAPDLALLVDGLQAEREQGITIDVAYRYFSTDRRAFIIADTPGHEQYTGNMVTGASTSDLAVILVDARKGILTQTRRHSHLVALLGIRHVVLAVNKMDLVGHRRAVFDAIAADYRALAAGLGLPEPAVVPLSALTGDNVVRSGGAMPWHDGPTLLEVLETVPLDRDDAEAPFRLPVQWVNRPDQDFRGVSGTIVSGRLAPGDGVAVMPSGRLATVARIVTMAGDLDRAEAGQAVTVVLDQDIDVSRGDMLADSRARPGVAAHLSAHVVWMGDEPLLPGRGYLLMQGTRLVGAQVTAIEHAVDVNTGDHVPARTLGLNGIGLCSLALDTPIAFDPYAGNRATGGFILIDRLTSRTVGCGMIDRAIRLASNVHWQHTEVDKAARAAIKGQKPCVVWFTGLSGAGKSSVADLVERRLLAMGRHTYLLDGDNVRHGLNKNLGFSDADRVENIRRIGECARLFVDAGLIVLTAFISPFRGERRMARELVAPDEFIEVYLDTPLAECERRDPKGLYRLARAGGLANFTGVDSPYEPPEAAELVLNTLDLTLEQCAERIIAALVRRGHCPPPGG